MSAIHIRRYRDGDETALWGVFFSAIHEVAAADYTQDQISAWAPRDHDPATWHDRMRRLGPFVAERCGEIVGYADVQPDGHVDHFFVAGGATRQGIGTLLMRRIHDRAMELGLSSLFSEVSLTARPFFERWGFAVEQSQTVVIRGVPLQNFRMRKKLSASQ